MRSIIRKMGNSAGFIVPAPLMHAAGLAVGTGLDLSVQDGAIIATPHPSPARAGWAAAAATLATTAEEADWAATPLSTDADLAW